MKDIAASATCFRCKEELVPGASFCQCGAPTSTATFKERNEYETKQWRSHRTRSEA